MPTAVPTRRSPTAGPLRPCRRPPFAEVPLATGLFKTLKNVRTRGTYNFDLQRLHTLYRNCTPRSFHG
jgi:hypothetical protein